MGAPKTMALTGSTGAVGGLVARALADLEPILLVRDPARAPALGGEVRRVSYETVVTADLQGVSTLFMVSGTEASNRREQHARMIRTAAAAGVGHIVYTSFCAASPQATFTLGRDHFAAEEEIRATGMAFTMLRDNFYADILPMIAGDDGVIRGPAGSGKVAAVARTDVADVAAQVLRDPGAHACAEYLLSGPEALTLIEAAARAGAVLGRDLRYVEESLEEAYASRAAAYPDAEQWQLDAWVSTYTAIADGSCAEVTDHVARVTGHPAHTLEQALRS